MVNLDNLKPRDILRQLGSNPVGSSYLKLLDFINKRVREIQGQMVTQTDMDEVKRLQGRAQELTDMLRGMTRKPLEEQKTGGFTG